MAIELPEGYYLDNFNHLLSQVHTQYSDLLSADELQFHQAFISLPIEAQRLLVRLLTRKGPLFRLSKLRYTEIPKLPEAAHALEDAGLARFAADTPPSEFLPLFNKAECLTLCAHAGASKSQIQAWRKLKRDALNDALSEWLSETQNGCEETLLAVTSPEVFDTYRLLFFGNLHQDLTDFVLRDLGVARFESYAIDTHTRLFQQREEIDVALALHTAAQSLEDVLSGTTKDLLQFHATLPGQSLEQAFVQRRLARLRLTLARQLERLASYDEALTLYRLTELPPSRERQVRILIKQQQTETAFKLCHSMLTQPLDNSETVFAQEFGHRQAQKHGHTWPAPAHYAPTESQLVLPQSGLGVERDACEYFQQEGVCIFTENCLFNGVFGLHYWPVFFAPAEGAFSHPFQYRPHDLYQNNFLNKRQSIFAEAQASLDDMTSTLIPRWHEKYAIQNPFVHWEGLNEAQIALALSRIPTSHWQAIFTRMWQDLKAHRSGLPDLILFPKNGGYRLIEIKGPGDRLQKNQRQWMQYFHQHNIPHEVIHVEWA